MVLVVVLVTAAVATLVLRPTSSPAQVARNKTPHRGTGLARACVPPAPRTNPELRKIRADVVAAFPGVATMTGTGFVEIGQGKDVIVVGVAPGEERLAARLLKRFGNKLKVDVGGTRYCRTTAIRPMCPPLTTAAGPPGLHLRLHLTPTKLSAWAAARGGIRASLVARNDGTTPIKVQPDGQPILASVVRPGTDHVIGEHAGLVLGTALAFTLAPGEARAIRVAVGTWRCDGHRGTALPPGVYGIRAGIGHSDGPPFAPEVRIKLTR